MARVMAYFESEGAERAPARGGASSNGHGRFSEVTEPQPVAPQA